MKKLFLQLGESSPSDGFIPVPGALRGGEPPLKILAERAE